MLRPERKKFAFNLFIVLVFVNFLELALCSKCRAKSEDCSKEYNPTWESLDTRPLPQWYDNAKVGIFVHWGVYSVPSFGSEWFWINWKNGEKKYVDFIEENYPPGFTYQEFAHEFKGELFNATQWAKLFRDSGAQYVVLTSKHHDGFCLWPSTRSFSWNSVDIGPKRDIVGLLATAVRHEGLIFGLYYSLFEWFNRMYLEDKSYLFLKDYYVRNKLIPELTELVMKYKPLVLWSDGDWEAPASYWNSKNFLAWLYNDSPVKNKVVTNDRWGSGVNCKHGDFYTCTDRYNPGVLQKHKFENAFTIDKHSWGQENQVTLKDYLTIEEIIYEIVTTVSCGGNVLINVGPTKYGTIQPIFEERLREMGYWLKMNGEAIYSTKPWDFQNDTNYDINVWYTSKGNCVYAIVLDYPYENNYVDLNVFENVGEPSEVELLGMTNFVVKHKWQKTGALRLVFPPKNKIDQNGLKFAWVFKLTFQN